MTLSLPVITAALAGFVAVFVAAQVIDLVLAMRLRPVRSIQKLVLPIKLMAEEGREPTNTERLRVVLLISFTLTAVGWLTGGPLLAAVLACLGPVLTAALLKARKRKFRQTLQGQVAEIASAVADALLVGHSVHGALVEASYSTSRAAKAELRRVASALQMGTTVKEALTEMRQRSKSRQVDTFVAAVLTQQRLGGDLVKLLNSVAESLHRAAKVQSDARVATSQARLTALLIALMPTGALVIMELGSPGYVQSLFAKPLSAWFAVCAFVLQAIGALAVRNIARVDTGS